MPYPEPTLKELSHCLGVVLYSSISFCGLGGAYFWPYLWRVYFLKRYNTVINLCSLAQNKAHPKACTNDWMLHNRYIQYSSVYLSSRFYFAYLCYSYLNFTAPQCWPTGQFWLVLYNQHNFYRFWENKVIGQVSLSLFFYCNHLSSRDSATDQNRPNYRIGSNRTGGMCIFAIADFSQLKESVLIHIMVQF